MKIIERYVFFTFISIFLFCTLFLYVLFVIGDVFGFLDEILREGIGIHSLFSFYFYMMPFVITQIAPISCLLACVFLLGNLNRNNEITALKASGVSLFKVISPMLIGALVIGAFIFILNEKVVPYSMKMATKIRYEKLEVGKRGISQAVVMRNIALYGEGNKLIFAKRFDVKTNTLEDIIVHDQSESNNVIKKIAARLMTRIDGKWIGEDVVIYNIDKDGKFEGIPEIYKEKEIPIKETPLDFINNQWQPQFMGYRQLKKYLRIFLGGSQSAKRRFTVDLQYKLSLPFSCFVMILVAAPFTIVNSRGKALLGMAKGILIGLTYIPIV
ncbi:MAG: YjgP/YjgQ family permease, partial [Candidatus Omnitrophica bacterium]|nr:YjgP/YjgQ family permease [Candidatus Omnitrophota bacterium]